MMDIRIISLALAGSAALSIAAFTASPAQAVNHPADRMEMASRCAILESQFQDAVDSAQQNSHLDRAKALDSQGTTECRANEGDLGVEKLSQALMDLGKKPSV